MNPADETNQEPEYRRVEAKILEVSDLLAPPDYIGGHCTEFFRSITFDADPWAETPDCLLSYIPSPETNPFCQ